jgi:hypothetical protein
MTYPASLRQQAAWVREALDPATPDTQRITLGDVDVEELEAAADRIEALEGALREIARGEGRFSRDPYEHACNTIEDLIAIARAALAPEQDK